MLDFNNLHNMPGDCKVFSPSQYTGGTTAWQTWTKPPGCSFAYIMTIGGGAGGGGGAGNNAGSAKGGGEGGGSSGISRYLFPLWLLPEQLFVLVGHGGAGGAGGSVGSGSPGAPGQLSYVAVYPNTTAQNLLAVSGAAAATGGAAGTTAAAGTSAGLASTIATSAGAVLGQWALGQNFIAGVAGGNGGAHTGAVGVAVAIGTACPIYGGAGGAGCTTTTYAGGGITGVANTPFFTQAGGAAGTNGSPGFMLKPYSVVYGGCGGGSSNSATGGAGGSCGPDAFGGGGGGGGGGVTVGGAGGAGGPGLVFIQCW